MAIATPYRLPRRGPRYAEEDDLFDPENTGVSGGVDRGLPVPTNTGISGHGFPGGVPTGDLAVDRAGDTTPRPDGSVIDTGPNSTMPVPDPTAPIGGDGGGGGGRRGWMGQGGRGLNLDMPTGRGGYGNLEGFNLDRAFAGGDENSVKDAFARWVTGLGFDPARASKEEIEAVLRANMDSAAEYGLNILDVNGENILIETAERGPEWVDVVRGAGAGPDDPDAAWWWGAAGDSGGGDMGGGGGGGMFGLPDLGGDLPPELLDAAGGEGDLLARIRAELDALVNGTPSPMGRTALTSQLRSL